LPRIQQLIRHAASRLASAGVPDADTDAGYPVIRGSDAQLRAWIERYDAAAPVPVDSARQRSLAASTGSASVLDLVPYIPAERYQGPVANCWAWTGTGILERLLAPVGARGAELRQHPARIAAVILKLTSLCLGIA